jgi:hypothetical protein
MLNAIGLLLGVSVTVMAAILMWRLAAGRSGGSLLKDMTVSRNWLLQHRTED